MAEGLLEDRKAAANGGPPPAPSPGEALFQRRIEFRPATKAVSLAGPPGGFRLETLNPSTDTRGSSGNGDAAPRAGPVKQIDGGEANKDRGVVDPELSYKITFRRIGAGLENMGNTCFLNSVLQCLTYTEPFAAYLQSGKHKSSCRMAGFCAMCALQNHVMTALQSTGKIVYPSQLVKNLRCISRNFRYARQEDAHEYMVNLLESMHKCCLPSGVPSESPSAYEKSLVHKIFGGRLRSQVKCMQCSYMSNTFDPFLDLSLDIVKADSIRKALGHFTAYEHLDGGERQYQCQRCKQKVRAAKRLTVHKAPYVLSIHLKRFGAVFGQKIDKRVEFEPTLDLKPFVSDPQEGDAIYTLYGVLVHAGYTTRSGHYYCYVRTSSGLWYSLNDNQVTQVSEKVVLAQKAYMLFYIRNRSFAPKQTVDIVHKENRFVASSGIGLLVSSKSPKATVPNGMEKNISGTNNLFNNTCNAKEPSEKLAFKSPFLNVKRNQFIQNGALLINNDVKGRSLKPTEENMVLDSLVKNGSPNCLSPGVDVSKSTHQGHISPSSSQCSSQCQMVSEGLALPGTNVDYNYSKLSAKEFVPTMLAKETGEEKLSAILMQESKFNGFEGIAPEDIGNKSHQSSKSAAITLDLQIHSGDVIANEWRGESSGTTLDTKHDTGMEDQSSSDPLGGSAGDNKVYLPDSSQLHTNDEFSQKDVLSVERKHLILDTERDMMSIKRPKSAHARLVHGPRHLLLASFSLRKKKKLTKSKKKCSNKKFNCEITQTSGILSDQGTSTSTMVNVLAVNEEKPAKKRSRPGSMKENGRNRSEQDVVHKRRDLNSASNGSENPYANGHDPRLRNVDGMAVQETTKQSQSFSDMNTRNVRPIDVNGNHLSKTGVFSMLMNNLSDAYVPKWDDIDQPQGNGQLVDGQDKGIGHILDEWDEEYDRGKRKKVRRSQSVSVEPNPFEEIAKQNVQQKMKKKLKLEKIRSGNQPFRIF